MATGDGSIVFSSAVIAIAATTGAVSACFADFGTDFPLPTTWRLAIAGSLAITALVAMAACYMEAAEEWSLVWIVAALFRAEFARNLSHPEPTMIGFLVRRRMRQVNRPRREAMMLALDLQPGEAVCELGGADGQALPALCIAATNSGTVVAMDPSAEAISTAKSFLKDAGIEPGVDATVVFVQDAVGKPELDDDSHTAVAAALDKVPEGFDAVCHCNCVYFWPDLERGMQQVAEMLKPGGRTVFYAADDKYLALLASLSSPTPFLNTELEPMLAALRVAGFEDIATSPVAAPSGGVIVTGTKPSK